MIKYNLNTINDWFFSTDNIIKVYRNNAICYYKIDSSSPSGQTPCFAVVDDITQYSDTEFENVFNKADNKWYKLNNLNQYEEYGVYGSGRTITYYEGKLTVDGDYEYQYSGGSWVNLGEVSGSTIDTVWIDPPSKNNQNASFAVGHYWGENYKMVCRAYISGAYSRDRGSFWLYDTHTPIEFSFYSNGFYYDFHNPTSTTAPNVDTGDYSWRIMKDDSLRSYENSQILDFTLTNGTVEVKLEETGVAVVTGSTSVTAQNWYNGLYQASIGIMNKYNRCHLSSIKIYNGNDELVNDIKFVKNQGVTGSQEISAYDSVLNVTYNNTNSYTPSYHIVSESGGTEYPLYYDEIQDPPNNLVFSSMAEAEDYECPWVGMTATIDGVKYVFSGDSQSGYEWVEKQTDWYTLQDLIDTHTIIDKGNNKYELSPTVNGIAFFRIHTDKVSGSNTYVDLYNDNLPSPPYFGIKDDSNITLYTSVDGYSNLKSAADSTSCTWAYWIDANTIEVNAQAIMNDTMKIGFYTGSFSKLLLSFELPTV